MKSITRAIFEVYAPFAFALLGGVAAFWLPSALRKQIEQDLSNALVTVLSILIAFIATSMTIVLTGSNVAGLNFLKDRKEGYELLIKYHRDGVAWGLVACIASLISVISSKFSDSLLHHFFFSFWMFSTILAISLFVRVVLLLHRILIFEAP